MSDEQLTLSDTQIATMLKALKAFGYSFVEEKMVREEAEKALAGERPTNVIGMFVAEWLTDAGLI